MIRKHIFLLIILLAITLSSLCLGKYHVQPSEMLQFLSWELLGHSTLSPEKLALLTNIFIDIRLPRIIAAIILGASLSVSGASFQALFVNPLVSPGLLGVLAGAAFGAAFGMIFFDRWVAVQISTLVFGFAAVATAVLIANVYKARSIIMLVLGGIISGAFFTAMLSVIKYAADPYDQLPAIVYWLMGSLSSVDNQTMLYVTIPALIGILVISALGKQLNAISMGEEEATTLGVNVTLVRGLVIFFATLISALTVMVGGMIGWVGLLIPHISRLIVGPNNQVLLPAAAIIGAIYLLLVDNVSRLLFDFELPIGIVTALIGIPFFVFVLKNAHRSWK